MNLKIVVLALVFSSASLVSAHPVNLTNPKKYETLFQSEKPMITMYTSPSCGPCRQMKPDFYTASTMHPDIQFCIVEINNPSMISIAQKLQIHSIPTLILSCNGKIISRTRGRLSKKELEQEIAQFKTKLTQPAPQENKQPLKKTTSSSKKQETTK